MWGWEIKICTKNLHKGTGHVISRMRSDDLHWPGTLESNISKTAGDTHLVTVEHLQQMGYGESNGHVTDDIMWPRKVKVVTQFSNISKRAGDRAWSQITMKHPLQIVSIFTAKGASVPESTPFDRLSHFAWRLVEGLKVVYKRAFT